MTQTDRVLAHLEAGKRLTCLNAFHDLGVTQVAARIFELKQDGHTINTKTIKVTNRYGDEATVVNYFLERIDAA